MAYCPKCGTKSPDEAKFCNICGTLLPQVAAPAPKAQQTSSEQPIQGPFPQRAAPPQGTVRHQPPPEMPPGFASLSQPPKKRRWGIVFLGLLIMLGGLYYIGSAPAAQQPSSVPGTAQPQGGSPRQDTPSEPQTAPMDPSGTSGQQTNPKNIVGRQAKIAFLEQTDQQISRIMQGVARDAGPEALNEISQIIEDINQTTLDGDDEDEEAMELLVLELSRLGCACEAIAEPDKKAKALQKESQLRQEFNQKFRAYKQGH